MSLENEISNKHIEEFLDYYYDFTHETDYAVLIKGKWGSGKTWFIKNTLKKGKENKRKYLYVSLNGVSTFEEIETMFFQQLHPVLASKGVTLVGNLFKGAMKTSLQVDFDGDDKDDGSFNVETNKVKLINCFTNTDNHILIFDDLERCSMSINDILGYINNFVEHKGYKTIIIANEDELIVKDDEVSKKTYERIKEKLIGQTFEITTCIDSALIDFFNKITSEPECRQFYINNSETIKELYHLSGYQNLRHVKHALWGFERLYEVLSEDVISEQELVLELLELYLVFNFEIKAGEFNARNINVLRLRLFSSLPEEEKEHKEKILTKILTKYSSINFFNLYLEDEQWEQILDQGIFNQEDINKSLHNSQYFYDERTPVWKKLLHSVDMGDDEFQENMDILEGELENYEITEVGIIKHITGLFLWLSDVEVLNKDKETIFSEFEQYINDLRNKGFLLTQEVNSSKNYSWDGIAFFYREELEFKHFCDKIDEIVNRENVNSFKNDLPQFLESMNHNTQEFLSKLVYKSEGNGPFIDEPILSFIKPDDFVLHFLELHTSQKQVVRTMFNERYAHPSISSKLLLELAWLKDVKTLLTKSNSVNKKQNKISFLINKHVIDVINMSIEILQQIKNKTTK